MADNITSRGGRTNDGNTQELTPTINTQRKLRIQLILATIIALSGIVLFIASFIVPPTGVIHSSVLVASGELFTFSGSLIGIDYSYKVKSNKI